MTTPMPQSPATAPKEGEKPRESDTFVASILRLCTSNNQARAELRRGLGRPVEQCTYLHRYLVPRIREGLHPEALRAHYAIAALIAARPRDVRDPGLAAPDEDTGTGQGGGPGLWWKRPNLGASLAEAVSQGLFKPDSAEGDLHLMARQSSHSIHPRLPSLTQRILKGGVPLDWAVLLEDLAWWNRSHDKIATRWLESYFRVRTHEERSAQQKESN
ncbi:type I-E CRISPR-associated protein Cse2/CasB [Streptomyces sp. NPDC056670]|uniref:type I-E CRISPR-associated protein Cse2/CasB n=1 Tax=Streptomyces sp. NPDC056670 TaxID=3345904 RepID=UPI0036AEA1BC